MTIKWTVPGGTNPKPKTVRTRHVDVRPGYLAEFDGRIQTVKSKEYDGNRWNYTTRETPGKVYQVASTDWVYVVIKE